MSATRLIASDRKRGQPIRVLGALLLLWCVGRAFLWQSPFPLADILPDVPAVFADASAPAMSEEVPPMSTKGAQLSASPAAAELLAPPAYSPFEPMPVVSALLPTAPHQPPMMLASHQLMWMSALSRVPVAPEIAAYIAAIQPQQPTVAPAIATENIAEPKRWSFDSWVFLRPQSSQTPTSGPFPSTYGASQAGAVLRYRLMPSNRHKPSAYLRATQALASVQEADIAIGLSARPFAKVPITAQAEARASRRPGNTEFRPAAFLVTELPPAELPLGVRVSAYGQAGYVGGEFATAFADGQARVDREVGNFNLAKLEPRLRAGAGAWGGAQKGASRLDVGPTASLDIKIGKAPARLSMDYRHRVVGDAEPQSGVAITLSTGF